MCQKCGQVHAEAIIYPPQNTTPPQRKPLTDDELNRHGDVVEELRDAINRLEWEVIELKIENKKLEGAQPETDGMSEFWADLKRSRTKYPKNERMFDGLIGEVGELRRAYAGDGDIRAEAFDVAVCAFRIATEGDTGGNMNLTQTQPKLKPVSLLNLVELVHEKVALSQTSEGHEIACMPPSVWLYIKKQVLDLNDKWNHQLRLPSGWEWHPIETAPKDGTEILLFSCGDIGVCYWRSDPSFDGWTWGLGKVFMNPTHWMPLIPPIISTGNKWNTVNN